MIGDLFATVQHMSAQTPPSQRGIRLVGLATAAMTALAGGALWCAIVVFSRVDAALLVVPCAVALVWVLRRHAHGGTVGGAICALLLTLLASAYAYYLLAAVQLAMMLGLPPHTILTRIGPDMAWAVTRANLSWTDYALVTITAIGAALHVWLVKPGQRRTR